MASSQRKIDVGMAEVFAIEPLPRHTTRHLKIPAVMIRVALLTGDGFFFEQIGMVARTAVKLLGNFNVAMQATGR